MPALPPQVQRFAYDSAGNMISSTAPDGTVTRYGYDDRGNVITVDRPIGTDVTKYYDGNDNLVKELSYGSNEAYASVSTYLRYVYDAENHLRYKVGVDGHVTEYRYDAYGQLIFEVSYTDNAYPYDSVDITEAQMDTWRDGQSDKTQRAISRHYYDGRGNLAATTNYGGATATGDPTSTVGGYLKTSYVYDQEGRLLTRYASGEGGEQFVYDGMGRTISSSSAAGEVTSVFFDDANTRTVVQMASGLTRTLTYNKAGDLISETESALGTYSANLESSLPSDWKIGRTARTETTAISGNPAYKYESPVAGKYGYTNSQTWVAAGETVRYRITIKGDGFTTGHQLGIYAQYDGWGDNATTNVQGTIINGPGKFTQDVGGLWKIEGLGAGQVTTVEITRTFDRAQFAYQYFYIGGTGQVAAGTSVILSNPVVTKTTTDISLSYGANLESSLPSDWKIGRTTRSETTAISGHPAYRYESPRCRQIRLHQFPDLGRGRGNRSVSHHHQRRRLHDRTSARHLRAI